MRRTARGAAGAIALAFALLTRLPLPARLFAQPTPLSRAVWAFPLAGALIGAAGGAAFALARLCGVPPSLAALWTLAATLLLTGALPEDGLADTADRFGRGRTPEHSLAIMRDSRIGTYGALALMLSLGIRAAALAALPSPGTALAALVASGALGRAAMLVPLSQLTPARPDGLAASLAATTPSACIAGAAVAILAAALALPLPLAAGAVAFAALCGAAMARLARRKIGGYTGDVLGAAEQVAECAVLTLLAAAASAG